MGNHTIYLSKEREYYIEKCTNGSVAKYLRNKVDDDIEKIPTEKYCDKKIEFWKKQKQLAKGRKKK